MGYRTDAQIVDIYRKAIDEGHGHEEAVSVACEAAGVGRSGSYVVENLCAEAYFEDTFAAIQR